MWTSCFYFTPTDWTEICEVKPGILCPKWPSVRPPLGYPASSHSPHLCRFAPLPWWRSNTQHTEKPSKGWAGSTSFSSAKIYVWRVENAGMSHSCSHFILQRGVWSRQNHRERACCSRGNDKSAALIPDDFLIPQSSPPSLRSWPQFCFNNPRVYTQGPLRTSETYKNSVGYWSAELRILWNYSNSSLLKLLWKSYFWNQFLFSPYYLLTFTFEP